MFKRFAVLAAVGMLCVACMTPPVARQIQTSFPIEKPFDPVWQAVIEVFAESNLSILNMEKVSGLITTDRVDFSSKPEYSDCGSMGMMGVMQARTGKFNVYVKRVSDNSCEVKINVIFEVGYRVIGSGTDSSRQCVSTGKLEAEIFKKIQEKLK